VREHALDQRVYVFERFTMLHRAVGRFYIAGAFIGRVASLVIRITL
jgi:hypothetical protein